ncbi:hypothetical protein QR680_000252 [Steinernema hermaphroditum]|uniref:Uncharacterized protein n=1 Tax=Steinernema hermaphroditum TaxID=289476 RepID=A0AA39GUV0_9BILA|nr:hypothetical protein QR680_000252 [Steinernema hermaphroditum]
MKYEHEKAKTLPTDEPTLSRKKRYSGYEIDCRLFYDKTICFRIYDDNLCNVPRDVTCWKIQPRGWNCTETENVNYLNRHMTGCSQQYGNHQMFDLSSRQSDCNIDAWGEQSCRYTIPNNPFDDWFAQQRQYADRMSRAHSRGQVPDFGYGCGYRAGDGPIHADKPDIYRGAQGNTITVHRETTIVQNNGQGGHLNNGRHQETAEHGTMSYYGSDRTNNNQDGDYRRRQGDGPLRAERPDMHRGNQKQSRAQYWETRVTTEYRDDCHPNHGRDICFRVYETRDCEIPRDMTCWNIGTHQLNCTTIDNVRFLHKRSAYYGSRRSEQLCSDDQWGGRLCVSNPVGNYGREYDRRPVYHEQYGQARQREYGNQRLGDGRIHADRTDPYQGQRGSGYHRGNSFDSRSSSHSSTSSSSYQFHSSSSSHGGSYQQAQRGTSYGYGQRASDGRIYADRTDPYRGQQAGCGSYC